MIPGLEKSSLFYTRICKLFGHCWDEFPCTYKYTIILVNLISNLKVKAHLLSSYCSWVSGLFLHTVLTAMLGFVGISSYYSNYHPSLGTLFTLFQLSSWTNFYNFVQTVVVAISFSFLGFCFHSFIWLHHIFLWVVGPKNIKLFANRTSMGFRYVTCC